MWCLAIHKRIASSSPPPPIDRFSALPTFSNSSSSSSHCHRQQHACALRSDLSHCVCVSDARNLGLTSARRAVQLLHANEQKSQHLCNGNGELCRRPLGHACAHTIEISCVIFIAQFGRRRRLCAVVVLLAELIFTRSCVASSRQHKHAAARCACSVLGNTRNACARIHVEQHMHACVACVGSVCGMVLMDGAPQDWDNYVRRGNAHDRSLTNDHT